MNGYNQRTTILTLLLICTLQATLLGLDKKVVDSLNQVLATPNLQSKQKLTVLVDLAEAFKKKQKGKAFDYGYRALAVGILLEDQESLGKVYYQLARLHHHHHQLDSGIWYRKQAIEIYQKLDNSVEVIRNKAGMALSYSEKDELSKALSIYEEMLPLMDKYPSKKPTKEEIIRRMGTMARKLGDYPTALEKHYIYLKYAEKHQKNDWLCRAWLDLGSDYLVSRDFPKSLHAYSQAIIYAQKAKRKGWEAGALRSLAGVYHDLEQWDSAMVYYSKALDLNQQIGRKGGIAACYNGLGSICDREDKHQESLVYHQKALKILRTRKQQGRIAHTLIRIGNRLINLNQFDSASFYIQKGYQLAKKINYLRYEVYGVGQLNELYAKQGDYQKAHQYLDQYIFLKDSLVNKEKIREFSRLEAKFHYDKEKQVLVVEQEKEVLKLEQRQQIIAIVGSLLAILALVLYRSYRIKTRANILLGKQSAQLQEQAEELSIQNEELTTINHQLDETNQALEVSRKKEKELMEATIQTKEQQLTTTMMASCEKNELLEQIEQKVKKLEGEVPKETKLKLREIKRIVSANKHLDKDWDSFVHQFDNVHPQFFEKLQQENPSLTINDLKVCAYLKIGMQTKEIATITNVSPGSTYKQLYRLKKKLALPADMTVRDWVFSL